MNNLWPKANKEDSWFLPHVDPKCTPNSDLTSNGIYYIDFCFKYDSTYCPICGKWYEDPKDYIPRPPKHDLGKCDAITTGQCKS